MSAVPFTYQTFETARMQLVGRIHELLNGKDKVLLLSFNSGEQDGGGLSHVALFRVIVYQLVYSINPCRESSQPRPKRGCC